MIIFRRKLTRENSQIVSDVPDAVLSSVKDEKIDEVVLDNEWKRKDEIRRLLVSFGILLIVGVSLCFLVPYAKNIAKLYFETTPSIIIYVFLMPFFWALLGWTLMQAFAVFGIVRIHQTRQTRAIHIAVLTLILLYVVTMLPFAIESIKCMVLNFQYHQNPAAYPNSFSYSYHIPVFLQTIEYKILILKEKSAIFTVLGVILWLCKPDKKRRYQRSNDVAER